MDVRGADFPRSASSFRTAKAGSVPRRNWHGPSTRSPPCSPRGANTQTDSSSEAGRSGMRPTGEARVGVEDAARSVSPLPTVAIASEFLDAFARLPAGATEEGREFTEKFKADPSRRRSTTRRSTGSRTKSSARVRIDQQYRAVVLHPERGRCVHPRSG